MNRPTTSTLRARADELRRQASERDLSAATEATYESAWGRFVRWCASRGYSPLPASHDAVIDFLGAHSLRLAPTTLRNTLSAIAREHEKAGEVDPTRHDQVRYVMMAAQKLHEDREAGHVEEETISVEDVLTPDLRAMVAAIPDDLAGKRDKVALLVGAVARLERGELAGLRFDEVEETEGGGALLRIGSMGETPRPVRVRPADDERFDVGRAIEAWLEASGITDGPLLRAVDQHGNVGGSALSVRSINAITRRAAERVGIESGAYAELVTLRRRRE